MRNYRYSALALLGLAALCCAGCHGEDEGPSIVPKHPVPPPTTTGLAGRPGKGGMVGGLDQPGAQGPASAVQPGARTNTVGEKAK